MKKICPAFKEKDIAEFCVYQKLKQNMAICTRSNDILARRCAYYHDGNCQYYRHSSSCGPVITPS